MYSTMLKFFGNTGNSDLTTPKASAVSNPFDSLQTPSRKSSVTSLFASGSRTPTTTKGSALAGPSSYSSQTGFFGSQALGDGGKGDVTPGSTFVHSGIPTTGSFSVSTSLLNPV